ncbi:hypothetical protein COY95_04455, partial [Candidatus Woesearchaeota archaeon CG_4_10_14_0_8_um_filter_47_5]
GGSNSSIKMYMPAGATVTYAALGVRGFASGGKYPANVSVNINSGAAEWSQTGYLTSSSRTTSLVSSINSALGSCTPSDNTGLCNVSINVSSMNQGKVVVDFLDLRYEVNESDAFTSTSWWRNVTGFAADDSVKYVTTYSKPGAVNSDLNITGFVIDSGAAQCMIDEVQQSVHMQNSRMFCALPTAAITYYLGGGSWTNHTIWDYILAGEPVRKVQVLDSPSNIALSGSGGSILGYSSFAWSADGLINGVVSDTNGNAWRAQSADARPWVKVGFNDSYYINRIRIVNRPANTGFKKVKIHMSDNSSLTLTLPNSMSWYEYNISPAIKVRWMNISSYNTTSYYGSNPGLVELAVYGSKRGVQYMDTVGKERGPFKYFNISGYDPNTVLLSEGSSNKFYNITSFITFDDRNFTAGTENLYLYNGSAWRWVNTSRVCYSLYESTSQLMGAYGFDWGSGTFAKDSSGRFSHGTIVNATWAQSGCVNDKCLVFNGNRSYVNVSKVPKLRPSLTISAWIKDKGPGSNDLKAIAGYKEMINLYVEESTGDVVSYVYDGSWKIGRFAANIQDNQWYFVTLTLNGSHAKLYINGSLKNTTKVVLNSSASTNNFFVGKRSTGFHFNGTIDSVVVYNRTLTAAEINYSYQNGRVLLAQNGNQYSNTTINSKLYQACYKDTDSDGVKDYFGIRIGTLANAVFRVDGFIGIDALDQINYPQVKTYRSNDKVKVRVNETVGGSAVTKMNVTLRFPLGKNKTYAMSGIEQVKNGTMEAIGGWSSYSAPSVNELSTEQVHAGTYSRKISDSSGGKGVQQAIASSLKDKTWYTAEAWVYVASGNTNSARWMFPDGTSVYSTQTGAWEKLQRSWQHSSAHTDPLLFITYNSPGTVT